MLMIKSIKTHLASGEKGPDANVHMTQHLVDHDDVWVYTVTVEADESLDADRAVTLSLLPDRDPVAFFANVLYCPFWCRPQFGTTFAEVPADTQALLWRSKDGRYHYILPLCGGGYVTSLTGENGILEAVICSNVDTLSNCETIALLYAESGDPYDVLHRAAKAAAHLRQIPLREARAYPDVLNYLGWCTWDAMEIWVNEAEIMEKCAELREKEIPVRWTILDDMWAEVAWTKELPKFTSHDISFGVMHASPLRKWEADPVRFPHGLKGCIALMKEDYGLQVGVWHPINGYWDGLEDGSAAAELLSRCTMRTSEGKLMPALGNGDTAKAFYQTLHGFLSDCGADFVKVDNQSCLRRRYRGDIPVETAATHLYDGLEASVSAQFGGAMINCMGMATENMLSRKTSAVSRCSDDFQPENRTWFATHLMQCAYNGLVQGQFYVNDWDMWWSDDGQAVKNSVLRALSGGPIYVSDRLGRSRKEIFAPICFSDGRILRPDGTAVPTADCLLTDMTKSDRPMKVCNTAGGTGYLAMFNLRSDGGSVAGTVSVTDIPGLDGEQFVMREYFSGAWQIVKRSADIAVTLTDADDFRLFAFTPIENGRAVLGDPDKYIGVRAVTAVDGDTATLYEPTTILVWQDGEMRRIDSCGSCVVNIGR